jgi:hypothetical protein
MIRFKKSGIYFDFFLINVDVQASLHVPRLILRVLKLTTI